MKRRLLTHVTVPWFPLPIGSNVLSMTLRSVTDSANILLTSVPILISLLPSVLLQLFELLKEELAEVWDQVEDRSRNLRRDLAEIETFDSVFLFL